MSKPLQLTLSEARGILLAAQGMLDAPPRKPRVEDVRGMIERLGAVQIDTISVIERSQYIVLWSRLGPYNTTHLDALHTPHRGIMEYWSHAASIIPMRDYPYYRADMLHHAEGHMWEGIRAWRQENQEIIARTLTTVRERGPMASADFEAEPDAARTGPWDWYGPKASRRALDVLWTTGDLMIHSRRASQRVFDVRERILTEAFGSVPPDDAIPTLSEHLRHFVLLTARALGVITPSWLWDYFRLGGKVDRAFSDGSGRSRRARAEALLEQLATEGVIRRAQIEGLKEPAYLACEHLPALERLRGGDAARRTTLLSPFDNLIWDRQRARDLWDYDVSFEAYVVPEKRRYGYYCLAILHGDDIVGRVDCKVYRAERRLGVRALYLEPRITAKLERSSAPSRGLAARRLLSGTAEALRSLARFTGAEAITVELSDPAWFAPALAERLA